MSNRPFSVSRQKNVFVNLDDKSVDDENAKRIAPEPDAPIPLQQTGQVALLPNKEIEQACKRDYTQELREFVPMRAIE